MDKAVENGPLFRRGQSEIAGGDIGRHERARLAQQHAMKRFAEAANAGQGADARRDGHDNEGEFRGRGAQLAPGDF